MHGNRIVQLTLLVLFAVTLVFAGLPAWGQPQPGMMKQRCMDHFKAMDKDQNGLLSLEEFSAMPHKQANPENLFKARDTNTDGGLSADEFCAGPKK